MYNEEYIQEKSSISDVGKVLGGMKLFSCNVKRHYERVHVPTALYEAEMWSMGVAEDDSNVMEMRCVRRVCVD